MKVALAILDIFSACPLFVAVTFRWSCVSSWRHLEEFHSLSTSSFFVRTGVLTASCGTKPLFAIAVGFGIVSDTDHWKAHVRVLAVGLALYVIRTAGG